MTGQDHLRIASYNIRAGLGSDFRRDALRVLDRIAGLDPDVIALQEADFRMGDRPPALPPALIRDHTGLEPLPVGTNGVSLGWHGNAILARPGLFPSDILRIDLPGLEPRGAVVADLEGAFPLRVVAVHLGLLRHSRRRQVDHIREVVHSLPPRPTVILGDFNEWSRVKGLGRVAKHFTLLTPGATFPSRKARLSLDRMAHTDDLDLKLIELERVPGHQPSDHLPIMAEVRRAASAP